MTNEDRRSAEPEHDALDGAAMSVTADEWRNLPGDGAWKNEMVESRRVIVREA
ncbi:hypothetical protein [Serinibacter arcticus]|uniref:Uncharacterized protein n=1 Tax=Serinibacter arcticus TaxID=1655435 RepID=A0A4Z1E133_9MICO|nr:hypothetical protein [Serinibacter arcticus]TGO05655.1 hypothetical protein SERN_1659 [Serinibacter arcticus]